MKKAVLSLVLMVLCILTLAQVPEYFNYQVIVRDGSSNNPLPNQSVSFMMIILKGGTSGSGVYTEYHNAITSGLGLVNLVIGNGTGKVGTISSIDWGADSYFLKVMIDKTGGANYVEMGTTQILSVPYALYAKTAGTADYNDLANLPTLFDGTWTNLSGKPIGSNVGDMLYWNGSEWVMIPVGKQGQLLHLQFSGMPEWFGNTYAISTTTPSEMTTSDATSGGNIISDNGASITERGVCWNESTNPTVADTRTNDGTGSGQFTSYITRLRHGTTYYLRAYATYDLGTNYGDEISFTTPSLGPPTMDITTLYGLNGHYWFGAMTIDDGGASVTEVKFTVYCNGSETSHTQAGNETVLYEYRDEFDGLIVNATATICVCATNSQGQRCTCRMFTVH